MSAFLALWLGWGSVVAETLEDSIRARDFHEAMVRIHQQLPQAEGRERLRLLLLLADCQVQLNQTEKAQETLSQLDPRTAPARFFRVRGQYQRQKGEDSLAEKDFREALKLSNTAEDRIEALCELALLRSGTEDSDSEALWSQALEEASSAETSPQAWIRVYRTRYQLLTDAGRTQAALDFCRLMRRGLEKHSDKRGLIWAYLSEIDSLKRIGSVRRRRGSLASSSRRGWRELCSSPPHVGLSHPLQQGQPRCFATSLVGGRKTMAVGSHLVGL